MVFMKKLFFSLFWYHHSKDYCWRKGGLRWAACALVGESTCRHLIAFTTACYAACSEMPSKLKILSAYAVSAFSKFATPYVDLACVQGPVLLLNSPYYSWSNAWTLYRGVLYQQHGQEAESSCSERIVYIVSDGIHGGPSVRVRTGERIVWIYSS